ncbi:MAG TPA: alpha-amylase family glycosyl hydrolase [Sporosarcina sp.]|nr:alpha-amylase family glycosyl hydrolase [Sporosarcina sp.]
MRRKTTLSSILIFALLFTIVQPHTIQAKAERTLEDESIYDLLVDRFNNGNFENDIDVDPRVEEDFSGGDFLGITEKVAYIKDLGFTIASIGPVFESETYDGNQALSYDAFEPRFGTEKEFIQMIDVLKENGIGVMADFPLNGISPQHTGITESTLPTVAAEGGNIQWDTNDQAVQQYIKEKLTNFVSKYDLIGIRLTKLGEFDQSFVNELIEAVKEEKPALYVMTNEASEANFDLAMNADLMKALVDAYAVIDAETSQLQMFEHMDGKQLVQFDDLTGKRFTQDMIDARMYPPTRWKTAATALLTLPGVPLLPYESEIAVVGNEAPETHPITNFKTDTELYDYMKNVNQLRNESETLRNGKMEILHNEDGHLVFTRTSDEETWVVSINNTSETKGVEIDESIIGEKKRLRGILTGDSALQAKDGKYRVVLERELAEVYLVEDDKGFNTAYLIATILIYTSFLGLMFVLIRRSKKKK